MTITYDYQELLLRAIAEIDAKIQAVIRSRQPGAGSRKRVFDTDVLQELNLLCDTRRKLQQTYDDYQQQHGAEK